MGDHIKTMGGERAKRLLKQARKEIRDLKQDAEYARDSARKWKARSELWKRRYTELARVPVREAPEDKGPEAIPKKSRRT